MKRLLDLICFTLAIPIVSPVFLLIALRIRWEDGGPVLFVQERIGKQGKPFACYKFRTMHEGEVTQIGKWLRATGLDEFAQIGNVFKGEMSLIGPRPLTLDDIKRIGWAIDDARFQILPGMSGLAQLNSGISAELSRRCDHHYAVCRNILFDIKLIYLSLCVNAIGKRNFRKIHLHIFGSHYGSLVAVNERQLSC